MEWRGGWNGGGGGLTKMERMGGWRGRVKGQTFEDSLFALERLAIFKCGTFSLANLLTFARLSSVRLSVFPSHLKNGPHLCVFISLLH